MHFMSIMINAYILFTIEIIIHNFLCSAFIISLFKI
uniref:Uncharacterized protein n=1 Tax=Arundo donax TaxID=35708 RepID=A0A0A8YQV6_ARUDO